MNIARVPKNCMRDIYMLLSEYLIEDYAHNGKHPRVVDVFKSVV